MRLRAPHPTRMSCFYLSWSFSSLSGYRSRWRYFLLGSSSEVWDDHNKVATRLEQRSRQPAEEGKIFMNFFTSLIIPITITILLFIIVISTIIINIIIIIIANTYCCRLRKGVLLNWLLEQSLLLSSPLPVPWLIFDLALNPTSSSSSPTSSSSSLGQSRPTAGKA